MEDEIVTEILNIIDIETPSVEYDYIDLIDNDNDREAVFIDGGDQVLFETSNFEVSFIRICNVSLNPKKTETHEFYALTGPEIETKIFAIKGKKFELSGVKNTDENPDLIRRMAELQLARSLMSKKRIVVLDGALIGPSEHESMILQQIKGDGNSILGLCKTTSQSSGFIANALRNRQSWIVKLKEKSEVNRMIVHLADKADHAFYTEALGRGQYEAIAQLTRMSKDPVFLGYPYGLVLVDQKARVSNKEAEYLRTKLMVRFGKRFKELAAHLTTKDAHSILDSISF